MLAVHQEIRDNTSHGAAVVEDLFGQRSHQTDRPAAIDETYAIGGQNAA